MKITGAQRRTMKCDLCDREYDADNASQCGKCHRIVCPECWGHDADPGRLDGCDGYCYKCEPFAPAGTAEDNARRMLRIYATATGPVFMSPGDCAGVTESIRRGWMEESFQVVDGMPLPCGTYRITDAGRMALEEVVRP